MMSRIPGLLVNRLRPGMPIRSRSSTVLGSITTRFPIKIKVFEPNESVSITRSFEAPEALELYVSSYKRALLKAVATPTAPEEIILPSAYSRLDPSRIYYIHAPLHMEESADIGHNQVTDRAFEAKSRLALEKYLKCQGLQLLPRPRELYTSEKNRRRKAVIDWDGFWLDDAGIYYAMECKHFMSAVFSHLHALY